MHADFFKMMEVSNGFPPVTQEQVMRSYKKAKKIQTKEMISEFQKYLKGASIVDGEIKFPEVKKDSLER